jgi:O-antigen/teichoic acid export membrane protein
MRSWSHVVAIAIANAGVAGLGFLGNLLLARELDFAAFAAISLFLTAFQFLQDGMGRSLNWAMLRLAPRTEEERPGGSASMVLATHSVQRRFAVAGPVCVGGALLLTHAWFDERHGPHTALLLGMASIGAAVAVLFQFDLSLLQLRERFFAMSGWMMSQSFVRLLIWGTLWQAGWLNLPNAVIGHLASTFMLWLVLRAHSGPLPNADPSTLAHDRRTVWRFGGLMVVATILASLAAQIDLFLLDASAGDDSTSRYRVATLVATVIELASSAVMVALLPSAGRASTEHARRRNLRRSLHWGIAIACVALLSLPIVEVALPALFGERYEASASLYPILLVGVVVTAMTDPLGLQFLSRDKPHRFVILNSFMLTTIITGNLLVPGDDRAEIAAWVRTSGRLLLGLGIVLFLWRDAHVRRRRSAS